VGRDLTSGQLGRVEFRDFGKLGGEGTNWLGFGLHDALFKFKIKSLF
jgi:hypothetical protein